MNYFKHLTKVNMTYYEHMKFSLSLSSQFALSSLQAFIHAFYPDIFITSSTDNIKIIKNKLNRDL